MRFPIIEDSFVKDNRAELSFTVSPELDWFEGHFEALKILPGMALCVFVMEFTTRYLSLDLYSGMSSLPQVKFIKPILENYQVTLIMTKNEDFKTLEFEVVDTADRSITYATGKFKYIPVYLRKE